MEIVAAPTFALKMGFIVQMAYLSSQNQPGQRTSLSSLFATFIRDAKKSMTYLTTHP